jgi:hypothetical protein
MVERKPSGLAFALAERRPKPHRLLRPGCAISDGAGISFRRDDDCRESRPEYGRLQPGRRKHFTLGVKFGKSRGTVKLGAVRRSPFGSYPVTMRPQMACSPIQFSDAAQLRIRLAHTRAELTRVRALGRAHASG